MTDSDWRPLAGKLTETIAQEVRLDPEWRRAFEQTPRHLFVPGVPIAEAYEDESIVIQTVNKGDFDWPTSSSTKPSLMAYMLMLLDLDDEQTVLEVGTGSGYNAALLCHRLDTASVTSFELDSCRVASIDLDQQLIETAEARLLMVGRRPDLAAGDGREIAFPDKTFDRIIATAGARRIPQAWGQQLNTDGILVTDFGGDAFPRIVKLAKQPNGTLQGQIKSRPGWFMPLRPSVSHPREDPDHDPQPLHDLNPYETTRSPVPPGLTEDAEGLAFAINFFLEPEMLTDQFPDGSTGTFISFRDGSWIETTNDMTKYGGSSPQIEELEQLTAVWQELGEPEPEDLRLTVAPDGSHTLTVYGFDRTWELR